MGARNPRLIYCSITGFGQTGPYRDRAGYDFMIQGMGGLMSITGERDDAPGGGPQKVGVAIADLMTGMYSSVAILAALHERKESGLGQHIDMALLDTQVAWLANQNANYLIGGETPKRMGNAHPNIVPYQTFPDARRRYHPRDRQRQPVPQVLRRGGHTRTSAPTRASRTTRRASQNRQACIDALAPAIRTKTTAEWIETLEPLGVPCGPINRLDQVYADPQVQHRGIEDRSAAPARGRRPARRESDQVLAHVRSRYDTPPPLLGEHTDEVLRELLGKSDSEIEATAHKAHRLTKHRDPLRPWSSVAIGAGRSRISTGNGVCSRE